MSHPSFSPRESLSSVDLTDCQPSGLGVPVPYRVEASQASVLWCGSLGKGASGAGAEISVRMEMGIPVVLRVYLLFLCSLLAPHPCE